MKTRLIVCILAAAAACGSDAPVPLTGTPTTPVGRRIELLTSVLYDPDLSITTPDFSNVAGWNDAWGPSVGLALDVTLMRGGGVGRTGNLFDVVNGRSWLSLTQRNISIVP